MRLLIVSPHFPPTNAADMQRVRLLLPYFSEAGIEAEVLAVQAEQVAVPIDPWLETGLPEDVPVHRVRALSLAWAKMPGLGTLSLRALRALKKTGNCLLQTGNFDLIYFSTTQFGVHVLGPYWKRKFGVPFVMDYQDPWVNDYYREHPEISPPGGRLKYGVISWLARRQEPQVLRHCSGITSVSPAYPRQLAKRYPWLNVEDVSRKVGSDQSSGGTRKANEAGNEGFSRQSKVVSNGQANDRKQTANSPPRPSTLDPRLPSRTLPFPGDDRDFDRVRSEGVLQSVFDPKDGLRHWVYVGRGGKDMELAVRGIFSAIQHYRKLSTANCQLKETLRLHFIGTSYAAAGRGVKTIEPLAAEYGLEKIVHEHPDRIPYFETLRCLLDASTLIVPGSDDPAYTASKIYPFLLARRPLLAVFHQDSSVTNLIKFVGGGHLVTFSSHDQAETLGKNIQMTVLGSGLNIPVVPLARERFLPYTAAQQASVLEKFVRAIVRSGNNKSNSW